MSQSIINFAGACDMEQDKLAMRDRFARYDKGLAMMVQASKEIKAAAPDYWKARGYTVLPRLQRLREDVMKED